MSGGRRYIVRLVCALVLTVTLGACEITINLVATVNRDGSGIMSLQFVVDRELVDLARNSGEDPLQAIDELVKSFSDSGWTVSRGSIGGGIQATATRRFSNPNELKLALEDVQGRATGGNGAGATFFSLSLDRSSGFLRTRTAIEGSIDLSLDRVLGQTNLPVESRNTLQTLIDQAANDFFKFRMRAELPGRVSSATGDPERIDGGVVEWTPRLGRTLTFRAETSAFNVAALAGAGGPAILLVVVGLVLLGRRRRRRRAPIPVSEPVAPAEPHPGEQAGSLQSG